PVLNNETTTTTLKSSGAAFVTPFAPIVSEVTHTQTVQQSTPAPASTGQEEKLKDPSTRENVTALSRLD
ncbi:MAG: hypothetical protein CO136_01000, partial [Candidatus Levybacteria bacterium CG_4_9_14_3_um_filter_36_7]